MYDALLFCIVLLRIYGGGIGENKETIKTVKNATLHNNRMTDIPISQSIKTIQDSKGKSLTTLTPKDGKPQE